MLNMNIFRFKFVLLIAFLVGISFFISGCPKNEIETISVKEFESASKYRDYRLTSIEKVEYNQASQFWLKFHDLQKMKVSFDVTVPVRVYRKGTVTYQYQKDNQRVNVIQEGDILFPAEVIAPVKTSMKFIESYDVILLCGKDEIKGNIDKVNNGYNDGAFHFYTQLRFPVEVLEFMIQTKGEMIINHNNKIIGKLTFDDLPQELVQERIANNIADHKAIADMYKTCFTKDNLEEAYSFYQSINDQNTASEIKRLIQFTEKFRTFTWQDGSITENPNGKQKGVYLEGCLILDREGDHSVIFGESKYTPGTTARIKTYKRFSLIYNQHSTIKQNGTWTKTLAGRINLNGFHLSYSTTEITHCIVINNGRSQISLNEQSGNYPNYTLVKILDWD